MTRAKIRKGQTRLLKDGTENYDRTIKLPLEHLQLLGWECGDILKFTADKRTGKLIAEKV